MMGTMAMGRCVSVPVGSVDSLAEVFRKRDSLEDADGRAQGWLPAIHHRRTLVRRLSSPVTHLFPAILTSTAPVNFTHSKGHSSLRSRPREPPRRRHNATFVDNEGDSSFRASPFLEYDVAPILLILKHIPAYGLAPLFELCC